MRNNVRISVVGSPSRIINRLNFNEINVYDVKVFEDSVEFSIRSRDETRAEKILKENGFNYSILKLKKSQYIYKGLIKRAGLIVSVLCIVIVLIVVNMTTLTITVSGNNIISKDSVVSVLNDNGVGVFSLRKKKPQYIEQLLLNNLEGVSFVTCEYKGYELVVNIREELQKPHYNLNEKGELIASSDGIITRIIVSEGTPLVKAGDTVRKGDVLIAPYIVKGEGDEAERIECDARGSIYAKTWDSEEIVMSENNIISLRTGNIKIRTVVSFGNAAMPESPFKDYDVEKTDSYIYGIIPLKVTKYIFYERKDYAFSYNDKEYKDILINDAYAKLNMRLNDNKKLMSSWIVEKKLDNLYIIDVYYELEELISGGSL